MTRSIMGTRRAAVLLVSTAAVGLLLSGCGAGQIAETAEKKPSIAGVNAELNVAGGSYKVRNLAVPFTSEGYPAGSDAPLQMWLFNDTNEAVTVRITSDSADSVRLVDASATPPPAPSASASPSTEASGSPSPGAEGSASPSAGASASPEPSVPAPPPAPVDTPAVVTIPANGVVVLTEGSGRFVELAGLRDALTEANDINLVFDFAGQRLETTTGLNVPLTPVPRASSVVEGESEEGDAAPHE